MRGTDSLLRTPSALGRSEKAQVKVNKAAARVTDWVHILVEAKEGGVGFGKTRLPWDAED